MPDRGVRIVQVIVVALALAVVTFRGRCPSHVRIALALALACDLAAVRSATVAGLDVAILATFAAAAVLIVDVATARGRSVKPDATVVERARESRRI